MQVPIILCKKVACYYPLSKIVFLLFEYCLLVKER